MRGRARLTREQFLIAASLFEGGLLLAALLFGWLLAVPPLLHFRWEIESLSTGLIGVIPLLLFFGLLYHLPIRQLQEIRDLLFEVLGPYLATCRWYELFYIALLAGFGEEVFFRGFLQIWLERGWGRAVAISVTNILFGLAHAITPLYTVLATAVGLYLSWSLEWGTRNLLTPILIHTGYDFFALLFLRHAYRARASRSAA